jgi:hypothetical protein
MVIRDRRSTIAIATENESAQRILAIVCGCAMEAISNHHWIQEGSGTST